MTEKITLELTEDALIEIVGLFGNSYSVKNYLTFDYMTKQLSEEALQKAYKISAMYKDRYGIFK